MSIEDVIARIERGTRMKNADGHVTGYVLEIDEWREIRAALRDADKEAEKRGAEEWIAKNITWTTA